MKKGEKAANEALASELRYQAQAIMLRAVQECHALGVQVYAYEAPGYGDQGVNKELTSEEDFDFLVDIHKEKDRRKAVERNQS